MSDDDTPAWRWCASDRCDEPGHPAAPAAAPIRPKLRMTPLEFCCWSYLAYSTSAEGVNRTKWWEAEGDRRKLCGLV